VTAGAALLATVFGPLRLAWSEPPPDRKLASAASIARDGGEGGPVDRLAPTAVDWLRTEGPRSAAVLFDGDQSTSLRTDADAAIRIELPGPRALRGIGTFGPADGTLSVAAIDRSGKAPKETAVEGLQDLDLGALPLHWSRFWSPRATDAGELVLRWHPRSAGAVLRELELFGVDPESRPPTESALADRLLAGAPVGGVEAWADPEDGINVAAADFGDGEAATFRLRLATDPRLIGRAFLLYELHGLPH